MTSCRLRTTVAAVLAAVMGSLLGLSACRDLTSPSAVKPLERKAVAYGDSNFVVIVYPDSMRGWVFYDDQRGTACAAGSACQMVSGPGAPPLGGGSAELADSLATDGKALILPGYGGTRLDQPTALRYSTYRQSNDAGNNLAISLQFNVDYDLTDAATGYQGRLVYEPYVGSGGNVPRNTWQNWDARAGKWWGSRSTVTRGNVNVSNPCVQNSPCTWAEVLAAFPNTGVHTVYGAVVLKAGSGWPGFRGNVDSLAIVVSGVTTLFDFELNPPPAMPASPPDSLPPEYATLTDTVRIPNTYAGPVLRQLLFVEFKPGTSIAARQSAIASVNGVVAGGAPDAAPTGGLYVIRVPSDSTGLPLQGALARLQSFPQVDDASVDLVLTAPFVYRKPNFGPGQQSSDWRLEPTQAFAAYGRAWALNAVNAPNAWGVFRR